jgi:RNA polymerase-binding transcription factor DksA
LGSETLGTSASSAQYNNYLCGPAGALISFLAFFYKNSYTEITFTIEYIFMSHLTPQFIEEMKAVLLERKTQLEADLAGLHPHTEVGEDYDENATEVQIDEVNRDMIERITEDVRKIGVALEKIEAGTYGVDDEGHEIAEERLRILPWADKAL